MKKMLFIFRHKVNYEKANKVQFRSELQENEKILKQSKRVAKTSPPPCLQHMTWHKKGIPIQEQFELEYRFKIVVETIIWMEPADVSKWN